MTDFKQKINRRRVTRRIVSVLVVMLFFIAGYNSIVANTQSCSAQYSVTPPIPQAPLPPAGPSPCGCGPGNQVPCTIPGSTAPLALAVQQAYEKALMASSVAVENYIGMAVDSLVQTVFSRLEQVELDLAEWFETYWHYNYRPSLQAMTEQANVSGSDQALQIAAITDAEQQQRAALEVQEQEARRDVAAAGSGGTETCAVATSAGGLGSANMFSRGMRRAWQREYTGTALNRSGSPRGPGELAASHAQDFENLFCNPNDNGGRNNCGASDPAFYNADTQVTSRLFNTLTIPVDRDIRHNTAVQHMIDNMVGRPRTEILSENVVTTASGRQDWIERRSYVARKNAARAVPDLIASWRMPGGAGPGGSSCRSTGSAPSATSTVDPDTAGTSGTGAATAGATPPPTGAATPPPNGPAAGSLGTAILAMGTNGDRRSSSANVREDTTEMIRRLQTAGYRVVVVLPVSTRVSGNDHNFPAYSAEVRAAATAAGVSDIVSPTGFNPGSDGYHISNAAAEEIARRFPGAATFGDSNSNIINRYTRGPRQGRDGARTDQIVAGQYPNGARGGGATAAASAPPASIDPGSCSFVAAMREGAGVPLEGLSDNPSYREIIHAMAIDRINSGAYALNNIGSAERQQMEKLVLNAIYLMQLRDYYELLERTALSMAVQVSVMADEYPLPPLRGAR